LYFNDNDAVSLAAGLSKSKKLHLLKLKLGPRNDQFNNVITKKGINMILKSVSELPELESYFFNLSDGQLEKYPPKLASMGYYLSEFSNERDIYQSKHSQEN